MGGLDRGPAQCPRVGLGERAGPRPVAGLADPGREAGVADELFWRGSPGGPPWAVELANGSRCVFASGASTVVDGRRLNSFCGRNRYLFGSPDTSRSVWRIRMSRDPNGAGMRKAAIRRSWR
jgi:hypothetical protein